MRCLLLLLAFAPILATAQPVPTPSAAIADDPRFQQAVALLETWIDAKLAYEDIPGVSLGWVHGQELVWSGGYGYADVEQATPATPATIYSICSISKLFTSVAVLSLRDAGSLRLDDRVADHLPWFDVEQAYDGSGPITVRSLLTHSSGLPRESAHPYWTGPAFPFPEQDAIIAELGTQQTLYPADRYFQYSNLGLTLAGQVVEEASGTPYATYVESTILEPLGLASTTPEMPAAERGGRLATGYSILGRDHERAVVPFFEAKGIAPAAGYASTVEDLARFAAWQFRLLDDGGTEILHAYTLRDMHRVHWVDPDWETTWGLGFVVSQRGDETVVGHGGSCPGYRSQLLLFPERTMAGIAMINAMGTNPGTFVNVMADVLGPALQAIEEAPDGATAPNPDFAQYTGLYRSAWGESAILVWDDGLAAVSLPTDAPKDALTKLQHVDGDTFRRVRDDGELGEEVIFVADDNGSIARFAWHGNYSEKVR